MSNKLNAFIAMYKGQPVNVIIWHSDLTVEEYDNPIEWDERIEELAEETWFDLDVDGNVCIVDDGDYEEEEV